MKIHISYETEAQREQIMKLLSPALIGARVKIKKDTQSPRKHIYITILRGEQSGEATFEII